ncbi:MAG TPA: dihydrodipicolinate synthase family protein [Rhizomicrobium sp.]|jgi:4-hydroxy-tetrahydrodipicolinate synthase|nr:dihydrodipicolinate synthase family protein [Rhizomicrobium sp.]
MIDMPNRRDTLGLVAGAATLAAAGPAIAATKPMRGVMPIVVTPYTAGGAVAYGDLARQMTFYDRCGCAGAAWPQGNGDVLLLSKDERMKGMKVIADACRGTKVASVLGVQAPTKAEMLDYARYAETLDPDALIAMPPSAEQSEEAYREYFAALATLSKRPIFIQTSLTGMPHALAPSVDMMVSLARQYPNLSCIKEETNPLVARMKAEVRQRPPLKSVFGASGADGWLYELRMGLDGEMTAQGMYGDLMVAIWNNYQGGRRDVAADAFSKLLLMKNCEAQIPGTERYIWKKRGVFKSTAQRRGAPKGQVIVPVLAADAIEEIEFRYATLKPYLTAGV